MQASNRSRGVHQRWHVSRAHLIRFVGEVDLAWDGMARPLLAGGATNPSGGASFLPLFDSSRQQPRVGKEVKGVVTLATRLFVYGGDDGQLGGQREKKKLVGSWRSRPLSSGRRLVVPGTTLARAQRVCSGLFS